MVNPSIVASNIGNANKELASEALLTQAYASSTIKQTEIKFPEESKLNKHEKK